jgi:hypothetical protein
MESKVVSWKDTVGNISIDDYLTAKFGDAKRYRISRRSYVKGDRNTGGMVSATCFVLQGSCRYRFGEKIFELSGGECCELPEGGYIFEALGDEDCRTILVLKIPSAP